MFFIYLIHLPILESDVRQDEKMRDPHPTSRTRCFHYCRFPEMPATIGTLPVIRPHLGHVCPVSLAQNPPKRHPTSLYLPSELSG